jgi:hypothetical protein
VEFPEIEDLAQECLGGLAGAASVGNLLIPPFKFHSITDGVQKPPAHGSATHRSQSPQKEAKDRILLSRADHIQLSEGMVTEKDGGAGVPWSRWMEVAHCRGKVIFHESQETAEGFLGERPVFRGA